MTLPGGMGETTTTINYTYDPLYRLTAADYSNGDSYRYAYDAVGNRLQQETSVNGQQSTAAYQYDIANRLNSVDGVNYTWDANGNLLNDGASTYTYDPANRMSSAVQGNNSYTFSYNGFGDRLQQMINGQTTNYTLDLNAGLTQVLDDGTNSYTYGVDRISQQHGTTAEYYLDDALGSVRQLTDASSAITLSKSYDPYGNVISSAGSSTSVFAFTGEQGDQTGLTYLRARYYSPYLNQFIQPDTIVPDPRIPADWNRYAYVRNNPINYMDSSGYITEKESKGAELILEKLNDIYNVHIEKDWGVYYWHEFNFNPFNGKPFMTTVCEWENGNWRSLHELEVTRDAIKTTVKALGGIEKFRTAMKHYPIHISRYPKPPPLQNWAALTMDPVFGGFAFGDILIFNGLFNSGDNFATQATIHELGHLWDIRNGWQLSIGMSEALRTTKCEWTKGGRVCWFDIAAGKEPPPGDIQKPYAGKNAREDWAEAFANYVDPVYTDQNLCTQFNQMKCSLYIGPLRKQYVADQIKKIP